MRNETMNDNVIVFAVNPNDEHICSKLSEFMELIGQRMKEGSSEGTPMVHLDICSQSGEKLFVNTVTADSALELCAVMLKLFQ